MCRQNLNDMKARLNDEIIKNFNVPGQHVFITIENEDFLAKESNSSLKIEVEGDFDGELCWAAIYEPETENFKMKKIDCSSQSKVICYRIFPTCMETELIKMLDTFFDPSKIVANMYLLQIAEDYLRSFFNQIDMKASYHAWLSSLWHSSLPCSDTKNITASWDGERAMIKWCSWKGKMLPCSAIFTKVTTDLGFCCAFNAKAAEEMYNGKAYISIIRKMQDKDRNRYFKNSSLPDWFNKNGEPKSESGLPNGLSIMLDAHTDQLAPGSVDQDFKGFQGLISAKGEFPDVYSRGFLIEPGSIHYVSMTATKIEAKTEIKSLAPWRRNCIFSDEIHNITLHKEYSPENCIFECVHNKAKEYIKKKYNKTCTPWNIPTNESDPEICDPWVAFDYINMTFYKSDINCEYCLPTCSATYYQHTITR